MKRIAAIAAAGVLVASVAAAGVAQAHTEQYRSDLSGDNEVPAVMSDASGNFKLKVSADHNEARFDLKIDSPLTDTLMAHIHMAPPGENGGVVAWLYPNDGSNAPLLIPGAFQGRLSKGTITQADLVGGLAGDWDGFLAALEAGNLYVNVHTLDHPGGEIRGQIGAHPG